MGKDINTMSPQSGRAIKENNEVINVADILAAVYDAVNGVLKTSANLNIEGDIEIGAVELKDATTSTRAKIGADGLNVDVQNIKAGTNIIGKIGIDQTTDGTTNKVQARNATHDNFNANANLQVNNTDASALNQVPTNVTEYEVTVELTLAASPATYTANDIINNYTGGNADTTLPSIDISTAIGTSVANRKIQINSIQVISSNGAASTKLVPEIILYNANALTGQTLTDNAPFNPTYAQHKAKKATAFSKSENWTVDFAYGNFYENRLTEIVRNATLDANRKLYLALISTNAYTPAANENIQVTMKFYLLN